LPLSLWGDLDAPERSRHACVAVAPRSCVFSKQSDCCCVLPLLGGGGPSSEVRGLLAEFPDLALPICLGVLPRGSLLGRYGAPECLALLILASCAPFGRLGGFTAPRCVPARLLRGDVPAGGWLLWGLVCLAVSPARWGMSAPFAVSTGGLAPAECLPCPLALGMSRSSATCTEICTPRRSPCVQGGVLCVADALLGWHGCQGRLR